MKPEVTVVVIVDYAAGERETYEGLRMVFRALAQQTYAGRVEYLFVETARLRDRLPADVAAILPGLRIVSTDAEDSFSMRNLGGLEASADIVACLDGDCVPDPEWLRALMAALTAHPEVSAVNGRTRYAGRRLRERVSALLSRSYVDCGGPGEVRQISPNNIAYRTGVLRAHPYPLGLRPFVIALHAGAILRDGGRLWFEPSAGVVHAYGGWPFEVDVSRNAGWATIAIRQVESQARLRWVLRLGYAAIPVFVLVTLARSCGRLLRLHRFYGVAWYELPVAFAYAVVTNLAQVPGMARALRGLDAGDTRFR